MIDLHCHLLPGVDDGPATLDESLALARAAYDAGTRTVVATPHLDHHWGVEPESIAPAVDEVAGAISAAGIDLDIRVGAEVALSRFVELSPAQAESVRLGGGPYLLIESPHTPAAGAFHQSVAALRRRGQRVLLAHPERSPALVGRTDRVRWLVEEGVLCSVTAGALEGRFGKVVRDFSFDLLRHGLVHNIASDSHDASVRGPEMLPGLRAAERSIPGVLEQAEWLTGEAPRAILAGKPLPERPPLPKRRRLRGLLAGRLG